MCLYVTLDSKPYVLVLLDQNSRYLRKEQKTPRAEHRVLRVGFVMII